MNGIDIDFHCLPFVPHICIHMYICLIVTTRSRRQIYSKLCGYGMIWMNWFYDYYTPSVFFESFTVNQSEWAKRIVAGTSYISCKICTTNAQHCDFKYIFFNDGKKIVIMNRRYEQKSLNVILWINGKREHFAVESKEREGGRRGDREEWREIREKETLWIWLRVNEKEKERVREVEGERSKSERQRVRKST